MDIQICWPEYIYIFLHTRHFLSINYDFPDMIWLCIGREIIIKKNPHICSLKPVWTSFEIAECEIMQKKKKNVSRFGLPCSSLYSVKQQTTVICTDRLCLSNGTAESHTEPQDRKREGKKTERGRERRQSEGTLTEGALVWARDCIKAGEGTGGGVEMCTFMGPRLCVWFCPGSLLAESLPDRLFNSASLWRCGPGQPDSLILYLSPHSRCNG